MAGVNNPGGVPLSVAFGLPRPEFIDCRLGTVAIFTLIPFNFFTAKVTRLQFELETAASNVEVMSKAGNLAAPK